MRVVLVIIGIVVGAFYFVLSPEKQSQAYLDSLHNGFEARISAEGVAYIKKHQEQAKPSIRPEGLYKASFSQNGGVVEISQFFDGGKVVRTLHSKDTKYTFTGTATYKVVGTTFVYSNIHGDKGVFFANVDVVSIPSKEKFLILSRMHSPLVMNREVEKK